MNYAVYILECADGTYYTGVARDVDARVHIHNTSPRGARYTRTRRPVVLRYTEVHANRGAALRREYEIKQLSRSDKMRLVSTKKPHARGVSL